MKSRTVIIACTACAVAGLLLGRWIPRPITIPLSAQDAPPAAATAVDANAAAYDQLARQYARFEGIDRTFELVARVVSPSVVHIVARKSGVRDDGSAARFEETGSGVIVAAESDRGVGRYVLTNHHVVDGSNPADTSVYLQDGRVLKPETIWSDEKVDIAVIKLPRVDLPTARLGDSDRAAVGSWVLALGSPFGLTHSVSQGIISARGRYEQELEEDGVENQDFLQTDAAINPGNSGGPLVNLKGEVVGLNTAIASNGGGSEGVGFSIPINLARWALNQLVEHGQVLRGGIGVTLDILTPETAQAAGLKNPHGARIGSVQPGSPAEAAGLTRGDVILKFNEIEVVDHNHLINLVSVTPIGEKARIQLWRSGESLELAIAVADRNTIVPAPRTEAGPGGFLRRPRPDDEPALKLAPVSSLAQGLTLVPIDGPAAAGRYGLGEAARGVLVTRVDPDAPLAQVLLPSDLIQGIDGSGVETRDDVIRALQGTGDHAIQFQRIEDGAPRVRIVQIEET